MMPRLGIDFSRAGRRAPSAGVALLAIAALLATAGAVYLWRAADDLQRAHDAYEASARHDAVKNRPAPAPSPALALAAKQDQAVLDKLTVPWQGLLAIVENYPGHDVALIGIDHNPAQRQVRFTAEGKDLDAVVAYLKYLQRSALLRDAVLSQHLVETTEPGQPVRFQIVATWRKS